MFALDGGGCDDTLVDDMILLVATDTILWSKISYLHTLTISTYLIATPPFFRIPPFPVSKGVGNYFASSR
jgi:hypothetical protein